MSSAQQTGKEPQPSKQPASASYGSWQRECAILYGDSIVAAGDKFGQDCAKVKARVFSSRLRDRNPWIGLSIEFPYSGLNQQDNDDSGFGIRYMQDHSAKSRRLAPRHSVRLAFPRGGYTQIVKDVEEDVMAKFPSAKKVLYSMITVSIHAGEALPMGLGLPYANDTDLYLDGVVNNDLPLVDGLTFRHLMASKKFTLVVAACKTDELAREMDEGILPPRLDYPYGEVHGWDLELYEKLWADTKAKTMFTPANSFADLNSMLAVNTQAVVQEVLWLNQEAQRIANDHLAGYLVPQQINTQFWVIIRLNHDWVAKHKSAWMQLIKNGVFHVEFVDNNGSNNTAGGQVKRMCRIVQNPWTISDLVVNHRIGEWDLVLEAKDLHTAASPSAHWFRPKIFASLADASAAFEQDVAS